MDRPNAKGLGPVVLSSGTVRSHSVIGRWQGLVKHDRTLEAQSPVSCSGASGQQVTVEIRRLLLNAVWHVADIGLPDAGSRVRSV